jgi:dipeptidyl aminopeptidase/acylaminoacyl peptidase
MSMDRLERRLPDVLTELSLPRTPDYIDDLLVRTERMPQRPGWTFLERWFPVSTFSATLSPRQSSILRPLVFIALLGLLVLASVAWWVGAHQVRVPPLFGPAGNGVLVASDAGSLVAVDPVTGSKRTILAGSDLCCAVISPDGGRIAYSHAVPGRDPAGLTIGAFDGAVVLDVNAHVARNVTWLEWSPAGDRLLLTTSQGARIVDVPSGAVTKIDVQIPVSRASWIGTTGDILLTNMLRTGAAANAHVYRLAAGTTTAPQELAMLANAVNEPLVSPDGSKFLYFIWGAEERLQGRIHVYDFATGKDVAPISEEVQAPADSTAWENAVWAPDGSRIAAELYTATENHVAIIPATGGAPVIVGPTFPTGENGALIRFSPDGASLLVSYRFNDQTWLLPVAGGEGRRLDWAVTEDIDWQRVAR